jgi:hypothetical protein
MRREEFKKLLIEWNNSRDVDILNEGAKELLQKAGMTLMGLAISAGVFNTASAQPVVNTGSQESSYDSSDSRSQYKHVEYIDNFERDKIIRKVIQDIYRSEDKIDQQLSIMLNEVLMLVQKDDVNNFKKLVIEPFVKLAKKLISDKSNFNQFGDLNSEVYDQLAEQLNKQVMIFARSEISPKGAKGSSTSKTKYIESSHSIFSAEDLKRYTKAIKEKDFRTQQEILKKYRGK